MKNSAWGLSENTSYKIVALLITLILWVIILGSKEAVVIKMVPAEYLLSRDMIVINQVPREVAFRVGGPRLTLKKFTESNEPLTIDLSSAAEGVTTVRIHPDSVNVPPGVRVLSVSPSTITPHLERVVTRSVPVEVQTAGKLPEGLEVAHVSTDPAQWEVSGARSAVEKLKSVKTQPLDLTLIHSSVLKEMDLNFDEPGLLKPKDARVKVSLVVK